MTATPASDPSTPVPGEPPGGWRQHMPFDTDERRAKAHKIISLLQRERPLVGAQVLEIGTGTGVIAAELAKTVGPTGSVSSIDTVDTRTDPAGYDFRVTSGVVLPFPDDSADVVVSNHVIEHVGDRSVQLDHLREMARVVRPGGLIYLATPSRWAYLEPHFRVPFLSWPPRRLRDRVLRLSRRGQHYDVDPYGPREIRRAFRQAGLVAQDKSLDALDQLVQLEGASKAAKLVAAAPLWLRRGARPAMPTMIFVLHPR